jgi:hypothetical protein
LNQSPAAPNNVIPVSGAYPSRIDLVMHTDATFQSSCRPRRWLPRKQSFPHPVCILPPLIVFHTDATLQLSRRPRPRLPRITTFQRLVRILPALTS